MTESFKPIAKKIEEVNEPKKRVGVLKAKLLKGKNETHTYIPIE